MNILFILLLSIDGMRCLQNGIEADALSTYFNHIATIWQHDCISSRYLCSATIITEFHVITAGSCVHNFRNYELYVSTGKIDLHNTLSVMVHEIHLHERFEKVNNSNEPQIEFWLNNIAILDVVNTLTSNPHVARISLSLGEWNAVASKNCRIMGWSCIFTDGKISSMTLEQTNALILGDMCSRTGTSLLLNEINAFVTEMKTTIEDEDIGTSLICDDKAIGIIIGKEEPIHNLLTVLTLKPYKRFIDYITAGGVADLDVGDFYYLVSISNSKTFRCGGFMVHNRYVVTAAHCIQGLEMTELLIHFVYFMRSGENPMSEASVEDLEIHPFYNPIHNEHSTEYTVECDIAILKLNKSFPWDQYIRFMDLPDLEQISTDKPVEIFRWNHPFSTDTIPKLLMKSFGKILNNQASRALGFHLQVDKFLTTGFYKQPIATQHDVGSPIIFENNIIGMVVAATGYPDPVTCLKIFPYWDFIRNFIRRTSI